jgi:hypothetical protein
MQQQDDASESKSTQADCCTVLQMDLEMEYKLFAAKCNEALLAKHVVALTNNTAQSFTVALKNDPTNKYLPELIDIYNANSKKAQGMVDAAMEIVNTMGSEYNFDQVGNESVHKCIQCLLHSLMQVIVAAVPSCGQPCEGVCPLHIQELQGSQDDSIPR